MEGRESTGPKMLPGAWAWAWAWLLTPHAQREGAGKHYPEQVQMDSFTQLTSLKH